jgi:DNA-binding transcriptional LysR family regulator
MNLIESLDLFVRIVEKGGMAAAGRELGLSPAMVTERLAALETHYGARLLNRTTRALSLTDEGRLLLDSSRQLVSDANDIEARIKLGVEQLSGVIRLSAPIDLGRNKVAAIVDDFIAQYPAIKIELYLSDSYVDLTGQGIDRAVRFGDLKDSTLNAVRLGKSKRIICAAPSYLEKYGVPEMPSDLLNHNCLLMRFGAGVDREWVFTEDNKPRTVAVAGNRIANDGSLVHQWCLDGYGVANKSYWDIKDDLQAGRLAPLLTNYSASESAIQVVYQGGTSIPRRVRALIDALVLAFAQ